MIKSSTKNRKSDEEIIKMIQKGLVNINVIKIEELTEGFFNIAYLVELENGRKGLRLQLSFQPGKIQEIEKIQAVILSQII